MSKKLLNPSCLNYEMPLIIIFSKNNIKKYRIHYYNIITFSFYLTTHGAFLFIRKRCEANFTKNQRINDMFTIFLQQIINSKLLLVIIVEIKK